MESQTSSPHETDTAVRQYYSAQDVADAFVKQYYKILQGNPKQAHNFYKDQSVLTHPCVDGSMKSVTTLKNIDDEIMASNIKEWNPNVSTLHAQDSLMDSVIVGVTGYLIDNDDVQRNFAQTFFLAPQEGGGFYVHNDILQFIEIKNISETSPSLDDVENPLGVQQADDTEKDSSLETAHAANKDQTANDSALETAHAANKDQPEKSTSKKVDSDTKSKVSESLEGKKPLPAEPKKKSQPSAWGPAPITQEDSKKVSYASVLAKEGAGPFTTQPSPNAAVKVSPKPEKRASTSSVVPKPSMVPSNGPSDNIYDVKAIRVKDLPPNMTQESLLEVVKQFGPVKQKNIQIKEYSQDGYRYAFVEFDNPKSAQSAVEARFIRFEDRVCEIQYKIIPNQGGYNNMGRAPYGRGGFRTENSWRRDGEGRGSGSWGNRHTDHENFGQHSGQARDYNQRRNRYFQDRQ